MLSVRAACWVSVLALSLQRVASNNVSCEMKTLRAPLGSSVVLPCFFNKPSNNWTWWVQTPEQDLINMTLAGQIRFLDPRSGRVKAFPMQSSAGNYSIRIDELQDSDLGSYRCQQNQQQQCVELLLQTGSGGEEMLLLVVGVLLLLLLLMVAAGCCCRRVFRRRSKDYVDMGAIVEGVCPAAEGCASVDEPLREPAGQQLHGRYNVIVYENDDQEPVRPDNCCNRNSFNPPDLNYLGAVQAAPDAGADQPNANPFQRSESRRTKQRFHRELFSRLRQASVKRHYYVNQGELRGQQAAAAQGEEKRQRGEGRKKKQTSCEYPNPIYNRSTDHLNRL